MSRINIQSSRGTVDLRPVCGRKGDTGAVGATGPSGGPIPDLTGVAADHTVWSLGGEGVEWRDPKTVLLARGHSDYSGSTPLVEIGVLGTGSAFHLLAGAGNNAAYMLGIGVDNDRSDGSSSVGETISVKSPKGIGLGINIEWSSGALARGIFGNALGPGKLVELKQGQTLTPGNLIVLHGWSGAAANPVETYNGSGALAGYIGPNMEEHWLGQGSGKHEVAFALGSTARMKFYTDTGSGGGGTSFWPARIDGRSGGGLSIFASSSGVAKGAETFTDSVVDFGPVEAVFKTRQSIIGAGVNADESRVSPNEHRWYHYAGSSVYYGYSMTTASGDGTEFRFNVMPPAAKDAVAGVPTIRAKVNSGAAAIGFLGAGPQLRKTFEAATGTKTRTTFDTTTVTLPQLAERLAALIDDLGATSGFGFLTA